MKRIVVVYILAFAAAGPVAALEANLALVQSVVKIVARTAAGKSYLGSGVVIADNRIATNCHVIRKAGKISVLKEHIRHPVTGRSAIPELDICILQTDSLDLPPVPFGDAAKISAGDSIYILGYPHAIGPSYLSGAVVALHPFRKSRVIEINTGFMQGSSGGGLFNRFGELIGLTTFMGRKHGKAHFYAIPIDWLIRAMEEKKVAIAPFDALTFWETGDFRHLNN
ncbi:MAG: S1 family peptidase [Gammaproteobacteria bacterium]